MKNPRERSAAEHRERSERDAPARTPGAPQGPVLSPSGFDLDGLGNRALLALLRSGRLRRKARVSEPGDPLEQDADRAAERVMRMPAEGPSLTAAPTTISRKCSACEEEEELQTIRRSPDGSPGAAGGGEAPGAVHDVLRSPGRPLDREARSFFEPRFGRDFSDVRVHTDDAAAESARSIAARAYTSGSEVVFAEGEYRPTTAEGRELLAHELAHVAQQSTGAREPEIRRQPQKPGRGASPARGGSHGRVLFVRVDRSADTITFVTESGSLVYAMKDKTDLPPGSYSFSVAVFGNILTLTAPGEVTKFSGFKYNIAPGQPNPADLLRGENHVSVIVSDGTGGPQPSGEAAAVPGGTGVPMISVPVIYTAIPLDEPEPGIAGLSSLGPGVGLGLHNFAFNDLSWLKSPRSAAYWSPLIPRRGITLERSLDVLPRDLTPTLQTHLARRNPANPLTWRKENWEPMLFQPDPVDPLERAFTGDELLSIEGLVHRYNANPAGLNPAELQLLRQAAGIHIGAATPTSPFSSYSRPGELPSWTAARRYVVRVNVDRAAALDVSQPNAFNRYGNAEAITNIEEAEFLVVGDQTGRIISVQSVESLNTRGASWATRNAGVLRWSGRLLIVAGAAYSGYRIATASPEDRVRVIGQELGGQAGGFAGGALGTAGCVTFGIATEGVGLFLCGLVGGVGGGVVGSYVGGKVSSWLDDKISEAYRSYAEGLGDEFPPGAEAQLDFWQGPAVIR
jgi:hypothetical protein